MTEDCDPSCSFYYVRGRPAAITWVYLASPRHVVDEDYDRYIIRWVDSIGIYHLGTELK